MKRARSAISFVEVLVVVATIGVLLAIAAPIWRSAVARSRESASLVKIRENVRLIVAVAASQNDVFPLARPAPGAFTSGPAGSVELPDGSTVFLSWFSQSQGWVLPLLRQVEAPESLWVSPGQAASARLPGGAQYAFPDYLLSHTVMASPRFFDGSHQRAEDCAAQRVVDVKSPAGKGMMIERTATVRLRAGLDSSSDSLAIERPVAFVDGHAALHRLADATEAVINTFAGNKASPVMTTRGGLRGRDF